MIKYLNQPYKTFLGFSICMILITALFGAKNSTFDIQLEDTFFEINLYRIFIAITVFLLSISYIYWQFRKVKLVHWLTRFHILGSISPLFIIVCFFTYLEIINPPQEHYSFTSYNFSDGFNFYKQLLFALILIIIVAQILWFLNILIGLVKYRKEQNIE